MRASVRPTMCLFQWTSVALAMRMDSCVLPRLKYTFSCPSVAPFNRFTLMWTLNVNIEYRTPNDVLPQATCIRNRTRATRFHSHSASHRSFYWNVCPCRAFKFIYGHSHSGVLSAPCKFHFAARTFNRPLSYTRRQRHSIWIHNVEMGARFTVENRVGFTTHTPCCLCLVVLIGFISWNTSSSYTE